MSTICPCITAESAESYQQQLTRVLPFAERLHIDLADGEFAPVKLVSATNVTIPPNVEADIHVMYQRPLEIIETLIALKPKTIIIPAESDNVGETLAALQGFGIRRGVALLAKTPVSNITPYIDQLDHVLIFSGDLGHFGGTADMELLSKVVELKALKTHLEIGWDGGINTSNASKLAEAGIDILNVGGSIQNSEDPRGAYRALKEVL